MANSQMGTYYDDGDSTIVVTEIDYYPEKERENPADGKSREFTTLKIRIGEATMLSYFMGDNGDKVAYVADTVIGNLQREIERLESQKR